MRFNILLAFALFSIPAVVWPQICDNIEVRLIDDCDPAACCIQVCVIDLHRVPLPGITCTLSTAEYKWQGSLTTDSTGAAIIQKLLPASDYSLQVKYPINNTCTVRCIEVIPNFITKITILVDPRTVTIDDRSLRLTNNVRLYEFIELLPVTRELKLSFAVPTAVPSNVE